MSETETIIIPINGIEYKININSNEEWKKLLKIIEKEFEK